MSCVSQPLLLPVAVKESNQWATDEPLSLSIIKCWLSFYWKQNEIIKANQFYVFSNKVETSVEAELEAFSASHDFRRLNSRFITPASS